MVAAAVDSKEHIPWTDLRYLLGSVFYGGHVVDEVIRLAIWCSMLKLMQKA